jgi:hypothetical protein
VKHRTIPHVIHTFDLLEHQGRLYAANGVLVSDPLNNRRSVQSSSNGGATWRVALAEVGRAYSLFRLGGDLYAVFLRADRAGGSVLYRLEGEGFVAAGSAVRLTPGAPPGAVRIQRSVELRGQLLYIGATELNGNQWDPFGFYRAERLDAARRVPLAFPGGTPATPYDVLVREGAGYVLASARQEDGSYLNGVFRAEDPSRWTELFRFPAPTFARSFEELDGDFYFGMGTDAVAPSEESGAVLLVPRSGYAR